MAYLFLLRPRWIVWVGINAAKVHDPLRSATPRAGLPMKMDRWSLNRKAPTSGRYHPQPPTISRLLPPRSSLQASLLSSLPGPRPPWYPHLKTRAAPLLVLKTISVDAGPPQVFLLKQSGAPLISKTPGGPLGLLPQRPLRLIPAMATTMATGIIESSRGGLGKGLETLVFLGHRLLFLPPAGREAATSTWAFMVGSLHCSDSPTGFAQSWKSKG